MPQITINGRKLDFTPGQTILQVALDHDIEIPHYCYHPGLSIPANCRICLAEIWAPNPRNNNALEPIPKLMPTCQTAAGDGQVVSTQSPKAVANQKAVMEFLLINHPVDCPVCDQAGECYLQDYSYQYGRSASRFQEAKNKQPKKDVGPHVLLYSDRCIMCTRCVRFTREVTGTGELIVEGRGSTAQIDVFPGRALDNELSGNVVDICPVGALLDKDFLFTQRVWFLKRAASIDGLTASGDNLWVEHHEGKVYRVKPRTNLDVNKWWITDEVRYGWKFVHGPRRLTLPRVKGRAPFEESAAREAWMAGYGAMKARLDSVRSQGKGVALMVSPMLSCEEAYLLGSLTLSIDPDAVMGVGPVPVMGEDRTFPGGFTMYAEKAPNARGVRRVLSQLTDTAHEYEGFLKAIGSSGAVILTGNYPSDWVTPALIDALKGKTIILLDTLETALVNIADVVLPGATWMEKSGTFENVKGRLQAFERAIEPIDFCKSEAQIALDMMALRAGEPGAAYDAPAVRRTMADALGLTEFTADLHVPSPEAPVEPDMVMVEL
ncbi:MAG: molybdopterin-dependent oxidoreductase [Phycisphaeraceae bacterium]|nr:MAG: molybdopterin-dependent oxidoreductase [Phycisphaeraceae bacterium]